VLLRVPWPDMTNGYAGDPQLFFTGSQVLAPAHLWDALNNLWLVAPLSPLWLGVGLRALWQPVITRDRTFRFLTGVAAGLLFYHFTFQNDLPRHQDWDLFAIVGPGLTLWGLYTWELSFPTLTYSAHIRAGRLALFPALTFAGVLTVTWVGVNHVYALIRPTAGGRDLYARYRVLDLTPRLSQATVTPPEPLCAEPIGCERVSISALAVPRDGGIRTMIFARPPAQIAFPLRVPDQPSFLWVSPVLDPAGSRAGDGVTFQVSVEQGEHAELLWSRHLSRDEGNDLNWDGALVPFDRFRGQAVTLVLITALGPRNNHGAGRAFWGPPWLMTGTPDRRFDR
jgi:hypothetical protein